MSGEWHVVVYTVVSAARPTARLQRAGGDHSVHYSTYSSTCSVHYHSLQVAEGSEVETLHDQGLSGDCQRRLVGGEATFSSLLFRSTSSKCVTARLS